MPKVPAITYAGEGCITGPNGEMIQPGEPVPKNWPLDVRQSLFDAGATSVTKPADRIVTATSEPQRVGPDAGEVATAHRANRRPA